MPVALRTVQFTVNGTPIGKGRPRFTSAGRAYTPPKTVEYEQRVRQAAWSKMAHLGYEPTSRRCSVIIVAVMPIPDSWPRKKRIEAQCGVLIPSRPDIDNIVKAALDACNKVVYVDDRQVWHVSAFKRYTDQMQSPYLEVKVQWDDPSVFE